MAKAVYIYLVTLIGVDCLVMPHQKQSLCKVRHWRVLHQYLEC